MSEANIAFALAVGDLRERAQKLAATIEAVERVAALPGARLDEIVQQRIIILRLLVDASATASGVFQELTAAVDAMHGRASA